MSEVKKITKSAFKSEWKGPNGIVFYHDVWLDGDDKSWNIGSQSKDPDFLKAGQTLMFDVKDAAKRSIKRAKPAEYSKGGGGSSYDGGIGAMVGNAITNAVSMVCHGKADLKDLEKVAHRICEISIELKKEFSEVK